jgi:glycosyltransferase involved in cell wall biosynthesis
MRIAQVAPVFESVPPRLYGGTERVVSYLTEELVREGHDVTLYASGDSVTRARLVSASALAARLDPSCVDPLARQTVLLDRVLRDARQHDQIHFHCDYFHFPFTRRLGVPHVTTLHGRLDIPDLALLYEEFRDQPLVSISEFQRRPVPNARWVGNVYHGLPVDLLRPLADGPGDYLAVLGRISPEKGVDRAIDIAERAGMPLKIAAKVDPADKVYFEQVIEPLLDKPHVEYLGEIGDTAKQEFLGRARALVFPIDWPEPFGLVMIEAMACGTPVVAFERGSVPEVIEDGKSGFVVSDVDEAVEAVTHLEEIDRAECRAEFERRFTAERMAADYLAVYRTLGVAVLQARPPRGPDLRTSRQGKLRATQGA